MTKNPTTLRTAGEDLEELRARIEAAREELGEASVAYQEARHRRDAAIKRHRLLMDELAETLPPDRGI